MTTSCSEFPGTSTPCHSDSVPNRQVGSSWANCLTSCAVRSSPWQSSGWLIRSRSAPAACLAARMEENKPRVRPPAASMSSSSSVRYASGSWSRPGGGRWRATYKMPLRGWSNGEPTSIPPRGSEVQRLPKGVWVPVDRRSGMFPRASPRPHWMASGANEPPRASVAEVSATVRAPNSRDRSTRPTSSGATRSVGGRRVSSGAGQPDHLAALGDLLAERVQDPACGALQLIQRSQGHPGRRHPLRILLLGRRAGPHCVGARPGRVLHGRQRGGQRDGQLIHPAWGRVAQVDGERGRRVAQRVGHGRRRALRGGELGQPPGAAGGHVHRRTRQLPRGGRGDPVHQVVRLVDDDHVVLGQHVDVGRGVDGQQRVVGHHDVRPGRRVPGPFGETTGAERAALRADALLRADRDLAPGRLGHAGHQLVPVPGDGLLGPLVQPLDLPSQRRGGARDPPGRTARPAGPRPPRRVPGAGTGSCACPSGWRRTAPGRAAAPAP